MSAYLEVARLPQIYETQKQSSTHHETRMLHEKSDLLLQTDIAEWHAYRGRGGEQDHVFAKREQRTNHQNVGM
jgi:hypothetical protein